MCLLSLFQILLSLVIIFLFVTYLTRKKKRNGRNQQENDLTSNKYGENLCVSGDNKDNGQELKMNLPTMSFFPILWNIVFSQRDKQYHNSYIGILTLNVSAGLSMLFPNEKVVCINILGHKLIIFLHPESAKEVLKSNRLINKDSTYDFFKPLLGYNSFFFSSDDNWRRRRKYLAPLVQVRNLKDDQDIFMEHSNVLVEKLKQLQKNELFDILKWMKYCTLDIIAGKVHFGDKVHLLLPIGDRYVHKVKVKLLSVNSGILLCDSSKGVDHQEENMWSSDTSSSVDELLEF
ncbi:uncharacterized protein LOC111624283 [Centruroides sculpturatus]|uniref:uncharacterized protein LOC111624283 n=1 Tax=Centruroides sculpturatus TaxID=218467 RepID=UPI000C6CF71C|nr:uncharacterized protein LOC111624283 [Centruroides sculpturatus]